MKKIFKMMFAVVAGIAALTACTNEPEEGINPDNTNEYVVVKVGMHEVNRSFTDAEGIKWNVGDQIKYAGGVELTSEALTAEDIEEDGYTANFKFPAALNEVNRTGWFSSTKNHPGNHNEVEFTLGTGNGNVYSQAVAGEMNSRYLFLHSGTGLTSITQGETPVVTMDIAGSIFRIMPYTELYNDEVVTLVELTGKTENGIVGTVAYDRGAGSYRGVNDINWQKSNFVRINLDEPFALTNANSRENSKGIYMALARTTETAPIEGYTYTVKTNKATYTFSSDENLVIGENEVKNVYLKLENGVRVDDTAKKGDLQYVGAINAGDKISYTGCDNKDIGYWYAQIKDNGSNDWVTKEGEQNSAFYDNVVFECIDNATGEVATWLTAKYAGNGSTHWVITAEAQTEGAAERSATITATFPEFVNGYYTTADSKTKSVVVTQMEYSSTKVLTFNPGVGDKTITNDAQTWDHGYFVIFSNGTQLEAGMANIEEAQLLYDCIEIIPHDMSTGLGAGAPAADWISLSYGMTDGKYSDAWLHGTAQKNNSPVQRQVLVGIYMTPPSGYAFNDGKTERKMLRQFIITQEAGGPEIAASLSNVLAESVSKDGAEGVSVATLALTVDGEVVADPTQYGDYYNVSVTGGATNVAVAADGTITANIPANGSASEKTYTVNVKDLKGNTLASAQFTQEAGNGGEVVPSHTFSYTIFNNAADGSKGTGFGGGAGSIGDWYRFENITIDGRKYMPGNDMNELASDPELMPALMAQCFSFGEITNDDVQIPNVDPLTTNPESFVTLEPWSNGGAAIYVRIVLTANDSGARRTFKIITKDGDGVQKSSIVYFQNQ